MTAPGRVLSQHPQDLPLPFCRDLRNYRADKSGDPVKDRLTSTETCSR